MMRLCKSISAGARRIVKKVREKVKKIRAKPGNHLHRCRDCKHILRGFGRRTARAMKRTGVTSASSSQTT